MLKKICLALSSAIFIFTGSVFASNLTPEEQKILQKAAYEFTRNIPKDHFQILAEDVFKRIQAGDKNMIIIDVRLPKDKYLKSHVPGAIHIPYTDIAKPEILAKLPKDKDIIVYCDTGHVQNLITAVLRMLGYRAYNMKWGMMSWQVLPPTGKTLEAIANSILKNYPVESGEK